MRFSRDQEPEEKAKSGLSTFRKTCRRRKDRCLGLPKEYAKGKMRILITQKPAYGALSKV